VILSMLVTPFLISVGPRLAAGVGRITLLTRLLQVQSLEEDCPDEQLSDHVIIAGYGITGQELARSLGSCGMAYVVVDLNVDNVRLARQNGLTAYFGDITSQRVLESLAISRARELVVAINDPDAARRTIRIAREFSKDIRIIVRTTYQVDAPSLLDAGANEVVSSEIEAAVEIVYLILKWHGAGVDTVKHEVSRIRSQRIGRS
jgi:CPA2 family monovalent cation:H+ antiporter-2